jgi:hypothetical protein
MIRTSHHSSYTGDQVHGFGFHTRAVVAGTEAGIGLRATPANCRRQKQLISYNFSLRAGGRIYGTSKGQKKRPKRRVRGQQAQHTPCEKPVLRKYSDRIDYKDDNCRQHIVS